MRARGRRGGPGSGRWHAVGGKRRLLTRTATAEGGDFHRRRHPRRPLLTRHLHRPVVAPSEHAPVLRGDDGVRGARGHAGAAAVAHAPHQAWGSGAGLLHAQSAAPDDHAAGGGERDAVALTRANGHDAARSGQRPRRGLRGLDGGVAGDEPQLAVAVAAPGEDAAARRQGQGVQGAAADRDHVLAGAADAPEGGLHLLGAGSEAQLVVALAGGQHDAAAAAEARAAASARAQLAAQEV